MALHNLIKTEILCDVDAGEYPPTFTYLMIASVLNGEEPHFQSNGMFCHRLQPDERGKDLTSTDVYLGVERSRGGCLIDGAYLQDEPSLTTCVLFSNYNAKKEAQTAQVIALTPQIAGSVVADALKLSHGDFQANESYRINLEKMRAQQNRAAHRGARWNFLPHYLYEGDPDPQAGYIERVVGALVAGDAKIPRPVFPVYAGWNDVFKDKPPTQVFARLFAEQLIAGAAIPALLKKTAQATGSPIGGLNEEFTHYAKLFGVPVRRLTKKLLAQKRPGC